jgi:hypothetical protein
MENYKSVKADDRATAVWTLAGEILGEQRLTIEVVSFSFEENFEAHEATINATIVEVTNSVAAHRSILGTGVGLVDAFFEGMIREYSAHFCSLDSIAIVDFTVNAHLDSTKSRQSDAEVTALLRVKNAMDFEYGFQCTTSSISHSSVTVVQHAIAFFINAELAYTAAHIALTDAKNRSRPDLVEKYQNQLATLVHATSYQKLAERLRQQNS